MKKATLYLVCCAILHMAWWNTQTSLINLSLLQDLNFPLHLRDSQLTQLEFRGLTTMPKDWCVYSTVQCSYLHHWLTQRHLKQETLAIYSADCYNVRKQQTSEDFNRTASTNSDISCLFIRISCLLTRISAVYSSESHQRARGSWRAVKVPSSMDCCAVPELFPPGKKRSYLQ